MARPSPIPPLSLGRFASSRAYVVAVRWCGVLAGGAFLATLFAQLIAVDDPFPGAAGDAVAAPLLLLGAAAVRPRFVERVALGMVVVVWCELHAGFFFNGDTTGSVAALPVIVGALALVVGGRWATIGAAVTAVTAPLMVWLGTLFVDRSREPLDAVNVVTIAVSLLLIGAIMRWGLTVAITAADQSERRFSLVFEHIPDGVVTAPGDGIVETANPSALQLLDGVRVLGAPISEVATLARARANLEVVERRAPDAGGSELSYLLLHDITERLAAEAKERRVAEQVESSQRLEAVGQLAGGVAHDLNNTLQALFSGLHLLRHELGSTISPGVRESVRELETSAERGTALVRQLLAFARRGGDDEGAVAAVDADEAIRALERMLRRVIPEDVELTTELRAGAGARVPLSASQWEQIIVNLVVNARDALPNGGHVRVETSRVDGAVLLAVIDDGVGMSDEVRRRALEPFFTTKPVGKGTGLGLSIVYGIAKRAGGDVRLTAGDGGRGTRIEVTLPLAPEPAVPEMPAKETRPAARGAERILIVDDDDLVRTITARGLRKLGYEVIEAEDGEAGVEAALRAPVDIVITDVIMPRLNGREAAERIVAACPSTRVLLVSGYTGDVLDAREAVDGRFALLPKPYDVTALAAQLRALLERPAAHPAAAATGTPADRR